MLGLTAGAGECVVPGGGADGAVAFFATFLSFLAGGGKQFFIVFLFDALFGFEDEAAAFVEVDVAVGFGVVGVFENDAAIEDVGVLVIVGESGVRWRDFENVAQLVEERDVVGALRAAGTRPALDEFLDLVVGHAD